jgi:OOP family OmpA-OmpF porin
MAQASGPENSRELTAERPLLADGELAELRRLLLGPEQARLDALQRHLEQIPRAGVEAVSEVLPQAIVRRSQQDLQLSHALAPTIEEAIKVSVKRDPQPLVEAIFPVMGPAIRKAIVQALEGMLQSLNTTLEYSVSPRGLLWRWEALQTGKSFAEVALLRTLIYRVEQVFLIHKHTGLLLQHVAGPSAISRDPEMISSMLTAIQDFVHDSFAVRADEVLDTFRVGELTVWMEQGTQAVLAGVIRGTPRHEIRTVFQDTLDAIHLEYGTQLAAFAGDITPFEATRPPLETCLLMQTVTSSRKMSPMLGVVLSLLVLALGAWMFVTIRDGRRWSQYVQALQAEPGIVVTTARRRWGTYLIAGLRDPLAVDPLTLLQQSHVPTEKVVSHWEPYQALSPAFVLARARSLLAPPATVTLRLEQSTLVATGRAPRAWMLQAQQLARFIPGVQQWQADGLVDHDLERLEILKTQIDSIQLYFVHGSTQLTPGQDDQLQRLGAALQALYAAAPLVDKRVQVTISGHTDQTGSEATNSRLSQQRAEAILAMLQQQGVDTTPLLTTGRGIHALLHSGQTEQDRALNRRVAFQVTVTDMHDRRSERLGP